MNLTRSQGSDHDQQIPHASHLNPCENTFVMSGGPRGATRSRTPGLAGPSRHALPAGASCVQARTGIRANTHRSSGSAGQTADRALAMAHSCQGNLFDDPNCGSTLSL